MRYLSVLELIKTRMVENFTKTENLTYEQVEEYQNLNTEEQFEEKLKATFKKLSKAPSIQVVENILNYSKSFGK